MKNARTVLLAATILGLLSDFLFHDSIFNSVPWGLNLFVWLLTLTVASLILTCRTKPTSQWKSAWFLVPPLFLAAGCAWRDSAVLRWLDVGAMIFMLYVASMSMMGGRMICAGVARYLLAMVFSAESLIARPIELFFNDVGWKEMFDDATRTKVSAVLRGVLIALPLLAVFGTLFVAADAAFEGLLRNSCRFDIGQFFQHSLLALGSLWWSGGFLYDMFKTQIDEERLSQMELKQPKLGLVEVGIVLGLIDLLFLAFVIVQGKYFFGGANLVEVTHGLTYAEYARRGFFELVTVASLVLPILLLLDWIVDKSSAAGLVIVRSLTGIQLGLVGVIMLSAVERMHLYQAEYGMTELRFYTTAFMAWLAIVGVIFSVTVLWGRRKTFAFCSLMSGLLVIGGLHVINPDAMIVKTNIARAKEGKSFDVSYALLLSNDAVPPLIAAAPGLPIGAREEIRTRLHTNFEHAWQSDWRSWNWSGSEAFNAVNRYLAVTK